MSGAAPLVATQLSQPGPAPRTVADLPVLAEPSMTVTSPRLAPAPPEPVSRPRGRRTKRRLARPLAVASILAGVLAASAAGGVALAASAHEASGAHSGTSVTRQAATGHAANRSVGHRSVGHQAGGQPRDDAAHRQPDGAGGDHQAGYGGDAGHLRSGGEPVDDGRPGSVPDRRFGRELGTRPGRLPVGELAGGCGRNRDACPGRVLSPLSRKVVVLARSGGGKGSSGW